MTHALPFDTAMNMTPHEQQRYLDRLNGHGPEERSDDLIIADVLTAGQLTEEQLHALLSFALDLAMGSGHQDALWEELHRYLGNLHAYATKTLNREQQPVTESPGFTIIRQRGPAFGTAFLYLINRMELTDYGTSVNSAWLTGLGRLTLAVLNRDPQAIQRAAEY